MAIKPKRYSPPAVADANVKATFAAYPASLRKRLLDLRALIFSAARETVAAGAEEAED